MTLQNRPKVCGKVCFGVQFESGRGGKKVTSVAVVMHRPSFRTLQISKSLAKPPSPLSCILKRFKEMNSTENFTRHGRPPLATSKDYRLMERINFVDK